MEPTTLILIVLVMVIITLVMILINQESILKEIRKLNKKDDKH